MKDEPIVLHVAYYYDIKLAVCEDKKILKEFLNRKMFMKVQDKITIESLVVKSEMMLEEGIEKLSLSNFYGIPITVLEYRILKYDYFIYLDSLCDIINELEEFLTLCSNKQSINDTINQMNNLLDDPFDKMTEWIENHSLINSPNIFTYVKDLNIYKEHIRGSGVLELWNDGIDDL